MDRQVIEQKLEALLMVHAIASDHLTDFSRFAQAVLAWMDRH